MAKQLQQGFYGHSDLLKVRLTMARLLTIVNERKILRNSYRRLLEDRYIRIQKHKEYQAIQSERAKLEKAGVKLKPTEEEVNKLVKAQKEKRKEDYNKILEELKTKSKQEEKPVAPLIQEEDLNLVA